MMGVFGFDGVWICLEHRSLDPSAVSALIHGCRAGGADAIIRIKPANYSAVLPLLEAGAAGIMLPRVQTAEEVRALVDAVKFAPVGTRGYDGIHADARFGTVPLPEYLAESNLNTFLVIQIEEPAVIPQIDAIAALPGVDVLFVGPGDLAIGLGAPGKIDHPPVQGVIRAVGAACARHGKIAGIPCRADQVAAYRALGYRFFNVISDYRCLAAGLREAKASALTQWGT